jgi:hypothetical protein
MTKWTKYTFVCNGICDALIEYTLQAGFTFNDVTEFTCVCGSNTTLVSVDDATIYPTTTKEETMETTTPQVMTLDWVENDVVTTKTYTESDIRHMVWQNKNFLNKQNEWYLKENKLRTILEEVYADSEDQETLASIAELFDVPLTKEIEYTAWVRIDLTVEVELGGDTDAIEDFIAQNLTVDSYDSLMSVNNYDVDRVEEGAY